MNSELKIYQSFSIGFSTPQREANLSLRTALKTSIAKVEFLIYILSEVYLSHGYITVTYTE